nr:MAG TPA: hypothetical protein [Caudoviricetes sp.]
MNKPTFFAYARRAPFGGRLSQAQIDAAFAYSISKTRHTAPPSRRFFCA